MEHLAIPKEPETIAMPLKMNTFSFGLTHSLTSQNQQLENKTSYDSMVAYKTMSTNFHPMSNSVKANSQLVV